MSGKKSEEEGKSQAVVFELDMENIFPAVTELARGKFFIVPECSGKKQDSEITHYPIFLYEKTVTLPDSVLKKKDCSADQSFCRNSGRMRISKSNPKAVMAMRITMSHSNLTVLT